MKKILILILIAAAISTGFYFTASQNSNVNKKQEEKQLEKVKLAVAFVKPRQIPAIIAKHEGLFKKYGLAVEIEKIEKDINLVLAAGKADAALGSPIAFLTSNVEGSNLIWVAKLANDNTSGIISHKQAKDIKVVGIQSGINRTLTLENLRKLELNTESMEFVTMASTPAKHIALKEKKIDAVFSTLSDWEIFKANSKAGDEFKVLIKTGAENSLLPTAIIVQDTFLKEKPQTVEKLAKAMVEASAFTANNKEKSIENMLKEFPEMSKQEAEIHVEQFIESQKETVFTPSVEEVNKILKVIAKNNKKAEEYDAKKFISTEIADSLNASKFLSSFGY